MPEANEGAPGAEGDITEEQAAAALKAMQTGTDIPGEDAAGGDLAAPKVNYVEEYDPENPTESQKQALAMGWNPEGVQGKRSVGADEYIDRQSFFDEIHKLKRENKKITSGVQKLISAQAKARQQGREEALKELKAQRQAAAAEGDVQAVVNLSEQIEEEQAAAANEADDDVFEENPEQVVQEEINEAGRAYLQANRTWYEGNDVMKTYADSLHDRILQQNAASLLDGSMTAVQVFQEIDAKIRAKFPDEFAPKGDGNNGGDKPAPKRVNRVNEGGGKPSTGAQQYTLDAIPSDQHELARAVMRDFKMSESDYVKSYLEGAK